MKQQEIKKIKLSDLALWTENPRDPIQANAKNQDIADKALSDPFLRWTLPKLAKEMGDYYDFSELPTVVYHGETPVVYDGNRRIILGMISKGIIKHAGAAGLKIAEFPEDIPCNVCPKNVALNNILRKHGDSGSWMPLERDIFLHTHMKREKSPFLVLEEKTHLITTKPYLNKRFVKEEIFTPENLKSIGFEVKGDVITSVHDEDDARLILLDISKKILNRKISTRESRGKLQQVLDPSSRALIERNKKNKAHTLKLKFESASQETLPRRSKRTKSRTMLFGGILVLKPGDVNDLYRDIEDLFYFYESNKKTLSKSFTALIRMSLRLLAETAAGGRDKMDAFLRNNFDAALSGADRNVKTLLSNHQVKKETIIQLLHTGAHNYTASQSIEQTIAISVLLGVVIKNTHGRPA